MQYLILSKMAFVSPKSIQFSSIYGKFCKQDYMKIFRPRLIRTMSNCRNYMAPLATHISASTGQILLKQRSFWRENSIE